MTASDAGPGVCGLALDIATVTSHRAKLWVAGYRPVPVVNCDATVSSPGKQPLGKGWQVAARKDPPFCAASPAVLHALNTGILCDGLRPVDIDIDDPALALRVRNVALEMLGDTIIRTRANSGRCLLTYRAVYGSPRKRVLTGCLGKIEILGHGQQFVALGIHPTGVDLRWIPVPPQEMAIDNLPAVTEKQITEFFRAVGPLIEAVPPGEEQQHNGQDHVSGEPQADPLRIAAALSDIPNDGPADWEGWNKVGMAVWRATGGSQAGWEAFNAWSARNSTYDPQETRERWDHYTHSPPTAIGAGTIFHMADAAKSPIGMFGRSNAGRHTSRRGTPRSGGDEQPETPRGWAQPLDFFADTEAAAPELRAEHLPPALWPFVQDASARMGVDPTSVAMACLVSCASVMTDDWGIQPKRFDTSWREHPRLWAATVGDPSILKTPVIAACTKPIDRLDAEARQVHQDEMRAYQAALDDTKKSEGDGTLKPTRPKLARYLVEGTTIEALSEILRDDNEAQQEAPAKKVLSRHDTGGRGGGDRGAYLRLYNGGRYVIDRIGRGSFAVPNWSACFLGGIQPGPIQRIAKAADDDGLLQRFMYCVPGRQLPGLDRKPDAEALERYQTLFPKLAAMHPSRRLAVVNTAL